MPRPICRPIAQEAWHAHGASLPSSSVDASARQTPAAAADGRVADGNGPARALQADLDARLRRQDLAETQQWPGGARLAFLAVGGIASWGVVVSLLRLLA